MNTYDMGQTYIDNLWPWAPTNYMQHPATKYIWPRKSASQIYIYITGPQGQQKFNYLKMTLMGNFYKPHSFGSKFNKSYHVMTSLSDRS